MVMVKTGKYRIWIIVPRVKHNWRAKQPIVSSDREYAMLNTRHPKWRLDEK